jgi:hypothetical protein
VLVGLNKRGQLGANFFDVLLDVRTSTTCTHKNDEKDQKGEDDNCANPNSNEDEKEHGLSLVLAQRAYQRRAINRVVRMGASANRGDCILLDEFDVVSQCVVVLHIADKWCDQETTRNELSNEHDDDAYFHVFGGQTKYQQQPEGPPN